jgi:N-acetylglucosamine-6-phosphate deacetylase
MKDSGAKEYAVLNGTVVLPDRLLEDGMVRWKGSSIVSVGKRRRLPKSVEQIDANGGYISPGFIDIHVHGGAGADFMDGTPEAVRTACEAHARHGTTTIFPTTTTGSFKSLMAMIQACATVRNSGSRIIRCQTSPEFIYTAPTLPKTKSDVMQKTVAVLQS